MQWLERELEEIPGRLRDQETEQQKHCAML